jgi:hypothetical protein
MQILLSSEHSTSGQVSFVAVASKTLIYDIINVLCSTNGPITINRTGLSIWANIKIVSMITP